MSRLPAAAVFVLLASGCATRESPLLTVNVVSPASVAAAPLLIAPDPTEDTDDEDYLTPCVEGSAEHGVAVAELAKLSQDIDALRLTDSPAPVGERLATLVETPCFVGVGTAGEIAGAKFGSASSLKTYWRDGGHAALEARLAWGNDRNEDRYYWLGPSIRTALTIENAPKTHPLAPLLCRADSSCGSETAGWSLRASSALRLHAYAYAHAEPRKTHDACAKSAGQGFAAFAECMQSTRLREDALPLGSFRAPTSGWLVLRGRRGHYRWCNELRAYDLATGSAYIASLCGGVASNAAPRIVVERGKLPLDALREAAWMMFLAGVVDRNVIVSGEGRALPPDLAMRIPKEHGYGIHLGSFGWSSGRTTLVYQWIRQGKSTASGTVNWPDAFGAAEAHAANLLAIAEAAFVKTCSGVAALPAIPWSARADRSTRIGNPDAYYPDYAGAEFDDLEAELSRQARGACTP